MGGKSNVCKWFLLRCCFFAEGDWSEVSHIYTPKCQHIFLDAGTCCFGGGSLYWPLHLFRHVRLLLNSLSCFWHV